MIKNCRQAIGVLGDFPLTSRVLFLQDGAICLTNGGACYSGNPPFADCRNIRSASNCSFCNFAELFFAPHFICRISIGDYHLFCRKKYFLDGCTNYTFIFCAKKKSQYKKVWLSKKKISDILFSSGLAGTEKM